MTTFCRFIIALVIVFLAYSPSSSAVHFLLVHGASHGAWCWYKVATLLEQAFHNVTAFDLAYSGRNPVPLITVFSYDGYHQPLFEYMERLSPEDKVLIVGHSVGGYGDSFVMERYPEKLVGGVFVSAFMVGPNFTLNDTNQFLPMADQLDDSIIFGDPNPPRIVLIGPHFIATRMYQNSPPEDLKLANYSIRTTQFFYDEVSVRQILVTEERYGSVPRSYIVDESDMIIPPDTQRLMIERTPPDVVKEIEGADHMVMFSKPQEFVNNLLEIAQLFGPGGRPNGNAL